MRDREACIVLNLLSGIGYTRFRLLVETFGSPAEALERSAAEILQLRGFGVALAENIASWRRRIDLESELTFAEKAGVQIVTLADSNYPELLREIHDPPLCLYIRGILPEDFSCSVAIVGSRRMSAYGRNCTRMLTAQAVETGWIVVSGLAYGVDFEAHSTVLENGGCTVAVLGGGLARIHPQEHIPLAQKIVENGGAVISEFPMNFPVSRQSFPRRNRIVSGLSQAVLVVEAGVKSGALITANLALEQGKSVYAVPGHIDNAQAAGCHKLIQDGCKLVTSFEDVRSDFDYLRPTQPELFHEPAAEYHLHSPYSVEEEAVLDALEKGGPQNFDALAISTGIESGTLLGILMKLEMMMTVTQLPGKNYTLRS